MCEFFKSDDEKYMFLCMVDLHCVKNERNIIESIVYVNGGDRFIYNSPIIRELYCKITGKSQIYAKLHYKELWKLVKSYHGEQQ